MTSRTNILGCGKLSLYKKGRILIYHAKINPPIHDIEVPNLRMKVGWGPRYSDYPALFSRANFYCGVRNEQNELIAFGYVCGMGLEHGYIEDIIVDPDYQQKGVGRSVVSALIDEAKKQRIGILTLSTDLNTKEFYKKLGFDLEVSAVMYLD